MTTLFRPPFILVLGLLSCSRSDTSNKVTSDTAIDTREQTQADTQMSSNDRQPWGFDTIERFSVDDYPVTNAMMDKAMPAPIEHSGIQSSEIAWFTNDTIRQTLGIALYTDHHRLVTFHCYNDNIPAGLIDRVELHTKDGDLVSLSEKRKNFKEFINSADKIATKYFTTCKGVRLGDPKKKILSIYGQPDKKTLEGKTEILEWQYVGDILYDGKTDLKGKPLAEDNYGHQARMFFRGNKLIALVLHNNVP